MLEYLIWLQIKLKQKNIFHAIVNANAIVQDVIQIKNGIMKCVKVSVKTIISATKIIVWILANIFEKRANI